MRSALVAAIGSSLGCNQLFGIEDLPAGDCQTDGDCGTHEFCNDHGKLRTCECVSGYARGGGGCTWRGVVDDPSFTNATATAWSATGMASLVPELGIARLPLGACVAALTQRVSMPRSSRAEPLVAELTYRTPSPSGYLGKVLTVGLGAGHSDFTVPAATPDWVTVRRCLGGGQYAAETSSGGGQQVPLVFRAPLESCEHLALELDHATILPAAPGECPSPGQAANGLADHEGGWTFTAHHGGLAGFEAGVGEDGSRGGKLALPMTCSSAGAEIPISPGLADAGGSPALSFYISSSSNAAVDARLDEHLFRMPRGIPPSLIRFCVPARLRGVVSRLSVNATHPSTPLPCGPALDASAILDTIRLERDPACGADPAIADPSFESGYHLLDGQIVGSGSIQAVVDPDAHDGSRVLELRSSSCQADISVRVHVITPAPAGIAGPALTFWYRMPPGVNTVLSLNGNALVRDPGWRQGRACLDPRRAALSAPVLFQLHRAGTCTEGFSESVFLDDLAVGVDPACPAQ